MDDRKVFRHLILKIIERYERETGKKTDVCSILEHYRIKTNHIEFKRGEMSHLFYVGKFDYIRDGETREMFLLFDHKSKEYNVVDQQASD